MLHVKSWKQYSYSDLALLQYLAQFCTFSFKDIAVQWPFFFDFSLVKQLPMFIGHFGLRPLTMLPGCSHSNIIRSKYITRRLSQITQGFHQCLPLAT